jgi:hypothetical protein
MMVHQPALGVAEARGPLAGNLLAVASGILVISRRIGDEVLQ